MKKVKFEVIIDKFDNLDSILNLIRFRIVEDRICQQDLARDLGIDPANLSRILNHKYNFGVDILFKLLSYFDISFTLKK